MNRLCPSEEVLSEYLSGVLPAKDRPDIEKHLASCNACRKTLSDAYTLSKKSYFSEIKSVCFVWIKENRWLIASGVAVLSSFLFPRYFLQFLVVSLILGVKWITDSRTTKMLIMIHEAWKQKDTNKTDSLISSLDDHAHKSRSKQR